MVIRWKSECISYFIYWFECAARRHVKAAALIKWIQAMCCKASFHTKAQGVEIFQMSYKMAVITTTKIYKQTLNPKPPRQPKSVSYSFVLQAHTYTYSNVKTQHNTKICIHPNLSYILHNTISFINKINVTFTKSGPIWYNCYTFWLNSFILSKLS